MKKIYFVGAPTEVKGIEQFNKIAGLFPSDSFYWICYEINSPKKENYKNLIFLTGLSDIEMRNKIKSMDMLICLSRFEGFCLPIAEAMLLKKPVISYNHRRN